MLDASPNLLSWEQEDRDSTGLLLKLRRPIHRTFHLVAAEIACKLPGSPALGPEKIASAGFVVRSRQKDGIKGFRQVRGRPAGWQTIDETADPDASRQLQSYGVRLPPLPARPGYTGEEVYPLHAGFVQPQGDRPHTLLFGYLPIGGEEYTAPAATATNPNDLPEELPWPFGLLNHPDGPPPWTIDTEQQVTQGEAQSPLAALLRMLLNRYQLADPSAQQSSDNAAIFTILDRLTFHIDPASTLTAADLRNWANQHPFAVDGMPLTLGALVRNPDFASALSKALTAADPTSGVQLPADFVPATVSLLVGQTDAAALRSALQLRLAAAWTSAVGQFPVPKYPPGDTQFMVRPFVRTIRPDGCERITWGNYSAPFVLATCVRPGRHAASADPDAGTGRRATRHGAWRGVRHAAEARRTGQLAHRQAIGAGHHRRQSAGRPATRHDLLVQHSDHHDLRDADPVDHHQPAEHHFLLVAVREDLSAGAEELQGAVAMSALTPPMGWPLGAPDAGGALNWSSGEDCLREALWNLLLTSPGERLMRPSFGAGLRDFLNQPNTETTRQLIADAITRAVTTWETRVTLLAVTVDPDPADAGSVLIDVSYSDRTVVGAPPSQLALTLTLGGG